ncbi:MAG: response regulator [Nitrospira sp.]|nr:MAG: response regulator [Nitrospira sp.]
MLLKQRRVLLVDDDHHVRILLKTFLETRGYMVELAVNGLDAVTKLGEADYDIVVTDYNMPEVNGLGVLWYIREHRPSIRVVLMTGTDRMFPSTDAQQLMGLRAQAYLVKPFELRQLEQTLANVLS